MEVYRFVWHLLAWSITVAVLWPIMFPWAKVAYKIWHGNKEIDEDLADELWRRSAWAATLLAVAGLVMLALDYFTEYLTEMPPGPIHIVYYLSFLALAAWIMFYCFSMEDFFAGLSLTVIYLYIPTTILYLLWLLIGWNWLFTHVLSWLKEPK